MWFSFWRVEITRLLLTEKTAARLGYCSQNVGISSSCSSVFDTRHQSFLSSSSKTFSSSEMPAEILKSQQGKLLFKKISENAYEPVKGSKLAAGFDLKSAYEYTVPKRGSALVKTDIQIQLPAGTYGRVAPRSGLALKNKIDVGAGVIDEDYRGNVGVILFNHGDEDFSIAKGDRIAQLICEKICYPEVVEVESLEDSERGIGGFGSTGVKSA